MLLANGKELETPCGLFLRTIFYEELKKVRNPLRLLLPTLGLFYTSKNEKELEKNV
jgi:hypothetical protein